MYYYIVDPPTNQNDQKIINRIKSEVVPEGVGGEFVFRMPTEPVSNLVERAIEKGFTTIVSVGGDQLVNQIAGSLYDQHAALGIIPLKNSSEVTNLIGYSDWKTSIMALRHRKLILKDLGVINGEFFFLDNMTIKHNAPANFTLHMNRFVAKAYTNEIVLQLCTDHEPYSIPGVINFVIPSSSKNKSFFGFFNKTNQVDYSILRAEQAAIQCEVESDAWISGLKIASTPISAEVIPQAVRVVVARQIRTK